MATTKSLMNAAVTLATASLLLAGFVASPARGEDGKEIYQKKCASCHGDQGKGDGPAGQKLKPPPEDFAKALKGKDDAYITKATADGGAGVGKSKLMPAYKGKLTDAEIAAVVKYSKSLAGN